MPSLTLASVRRPRPRRRLRASVSPREIPSNMGPPHTHEAFSLGLAAHQEHGALIIEKRLRSSNARNWRTDRIPVYNWRGRGKNLAAACGLYYKRRSRGVYLRKL